MPSSKYYQKQADICLKLAGLANSPEITNHLITLAADYKFKAAAADNNNQRASPASRRTAEGTTSP